MSSPSDVRRKRKKRFSPLSPLRFIVGFLGVFTLICGLIVRALWAALLGLAPKAVFNQAQKVFDTKTSVENAVYLLDG